VIHGHSGKLVQAHGNARAATTMSYMDYLTLHVPLGSCTPSLMPVSHHDL